MIRPGDITIESFEGTELVDGEGVVLHSGIRINISIAGADSKIRRVQLYADEALDDDDDVMRYVMKALDK